MQVSTRTKIITKPRWRHFVLKERNSCLLIHMKSLHGIMKQWNNLKLYNFLQEHIMNQSKHMWPTPREFPVHIIAWKLCTSQDILESQAFDINMVTLIQKCIHEIWRWNIVGINSKKKLLSSILNVSSSSRMSKHWSHDQSCKEIRIQVKCSFCQAYIKNCEKGEWTCPSTIKEKN